MRWYYDFISPYAYLQSIRLQELNEQRPLTCVPVLFAGLLNHWGQLGPAEIAPKRDWTFRDVVWQASAQNIAFKLPEFHPFNPLPLLRLAIVLNNDIAAVQRIFRFVWVDGHVPQNEAAFDALLAEFGVSRDDLARDDIKKALHDNGVEALNDDIFGVPTLRCDDELFWGNQATDMALQWLRTPEQWPAQALAEVEKFPQGPGRKSRTPAAAVHDGPPRLPYLPIDLAEPADVVQAVRERRGGTLLELDRLLLYSTPLATGWNHMLGNVRTQFDVAQQLRELAMCVVAVVNRAEYEYSQHAPLYVKAGGTQEKVELLRDPARASVDSRFTAVEQAAIVLSVEMTRDVQVSDKTFATIKAHLSDRHLVELIATVAAYNMVSRFLVALNVLPGK
jgi:2-hydroxychromene-2-carboxylate isomerase/alkylhydroperoxidase family enzyme